MLHLPPLASIVPHAAVIVRLPARPHILLHVRMEARAYSCVFRFSPFYVPIHVCWDQIYFYNI
jgi:hypothetical protein